MQMVYSRKVDFALNKTQDGYTMNTRIDAFGKIGFGVDATDRVELLEHTMRF